MPYIRYNNKVGRVDPSFPTIMYFDRDSGATHEDVIITQNDPWVDVRFKAANVQLCVNRDSHELELRKAGDINGWGGQWWLEDEGTTLKCDNWVLQVEGMTVAPKLQRVHRNGLWLNHEDGSNHQIIGSSELYLGWRYDREGAEGILPTLKQRKDLGLNNLRVFWQKDIFNKGNPWQLPVGKLVPFLKLCGDYGFYIQGTILVDCQAINPMVVQQQARVNAVRAATVGVVNHFEQLGNEYDKNGFDPKNFSKPNDRLSANASSTEGGKDATPYWDFFCFSGQRSPLNHAIREYGPIEFMYGWGGVPAICDECFKPGIGSNDPLDYYRAGAQARSGVGGRIHTRTGTGDNNDPGLVPSGLFTPLEVESVKWFVKGLVG